MNESERTSRRRYSVEEKTAVVAPVGGRTKTAPTILCSPAIEIGKNSGISLVDAIRLVMDFGAGRLKDAQKALILAEDQPFSLADAVRFATNQKLNTNKTEVMAYETGVTQYAQDVTNGGSKAHHARTVQRAKQFGGFSPAPHDEGGERSVLCNPAQEGESTVG